jgi:hypothetical protein
MRHRSVLASSTRRALVDATTVVDGVLLRLDTAGLLHSFRTILDGDSALRNESRH